MKQVASFGLVAVMAFGMTACGEGELMATEEQEQAIVNGQLESGWLGVGALTLTVTGHGYTGSFCTGTLIAPHWVLTAAHCFADMEDISVEPNMVKFYIGANAKPGVNGVPDSGTLYQAGAFYVPAQHSSDPEHNDIGLMYLSEPVNSVTPYAYNINYMDSSTYLGLDAFYVGFGITIVDGDDYGLKRSTSLNIYSVTDFDHDDRVYVSNYAATNSGICQGDSGGPGFLQIGGEWRVIGVNSSGTLGCKDYYMHIRVDRHAAWIADIISDDLPTCQKYPDMCFCADACLANGNCDNSVCGVMTCEEIYECVYDCPANDAGCQTSCYQQGTDDGKIKLDVMFQCITEHCDGISDNDEFQTCVNTKCKAELDACFPISTGDLTCEEVLDCMADCAVGDATCQNTCIGNGTSQAQAYIDAMYTCFDAHCGSIQDQDAWTDCVYQNCDSQINDCMPAADCDLTGGDCAAGSACWPSLVGETDCFKSDGLAEGATCDPNLTDRLACADGLVCLNMGGAYECGRFCTSVADCPANLSCSKPAFEDLPDVGTCSCEDGDGDGSCKDVDCDDSNASVYPGAYEMCNDAIDNDCDGLINEGCDSCIDADDDGFCTPDDCNDANPAIHPGAIEACGDGIDNNCNGQAEEGCADCTDVDMDGYCNTVDCNDGNATINPGAAEFCGDGIDNNCNGVADEGCGSCIDLDADGYCSSSDCDDSRADVKPNAPEICGDGVDNNCNGIVDDGCEGSGGCATASGSRAGAGFGWFSMAMLGLWLAGRRRRG